MEQKVLSPTVQDSEEADLGAEVFGIGGDGLQGLSSGVEENVVNHFFVLIGKVGNLIWHGEHDVEVGTVEQFSLTVLDPLCPCQRLALGAMAIATGVEAVAFVAALIAAFEMAAEGRSAAHFDGAHDAPLFAGHRGAMSVTISFAVAAKDIRHFQCGALHKARRSERLRRSGLGLNRYRMREQVQRAGS